MKAVFGLGNPGAQYARTRHNFGFWVIEALAQAFGFDPPEQTRRGWLYHSEELILMRPSTYMNLSGEAVQWIMSVTPVSVEDILIVVDDFALPLGKIRLRPKGSAGGHNGLKSVEHHLGTRDYARLKVGIGPVPDDQEIVDFVLGEFTAEEKPLIEPVIELCRECCQSWIAQGTAKTMSEFNGRQVGDNATPEIKGNCTEAEKLTLIDPGEGVGS